MMDRDNLVYLEQCVYRWELAKPYDHVFHLPHLEDDMSASSRPRRPTGPIEAFVPAIYTLLAAAVASEAIDQHYLEGLQQLIAAAQQAERKSGIFSVLPLLVCLAVGGSAQRALPAAAAWRGLHLAGELLDGIAAGSVAPQVPRLEQAQAANYAAGLLGSISRALGRLPARLRQAQQQDFVAVLLQISGGRHAAISGRTTLDLESYWHILSTRDGVCFALAARAGARCASSDPIRITQYSQCGHNVGIMLRIAQDLADFHVPAGMGAWTRGQRTLPVLYALQVANVAEHARLAALLERTATDREAEAHARHLIVMSGAEVYVRAEMTRYRSLALSTLQELDSASEPNLLHLQTWIESLPLLRA